MNTTLLGRLGWRPLNEDDSLWSRTLKNKYGRGREGLDIFTSKSRSSHIWKGMVDAAPMMEGVKWRLGNGNSIRFLEDIWLEDKPLLEMVTAPIPSSQAGRAVTEFWDETRGWRWETFNPLLPFGVLLKMVSMVVRSEADAKDRLTWCEESHGVYIVGRAYRKLSSHTSTESWAGWKLIWQLRVQQRIRTFLWLLSHGKLLSYFNRWRRSMASSPRSTLCLEEEETNLHAVRDCPKTRKVWLHFIKPNLLHKFFSFTLRE